MRKLLATTLCVFVAGCAGGGDSGKLVQLNADLPVAETVNGTPVPQALLEAYAKQRGMNLGQPEQRAEALRILADYVILAEQARRDNLLAKPQVAAEVELARLAALAKATVSEMQQQTPLSDEMLKSEYDTQMSHLSKVQYDFSQLLFANEDDAIKANGEALSGQPFPKVYDKWKEKAKQAKVFTRVRQEQLPEALGKALSELKNGETAKVPVKTQFGWHVVHLDIANPFTPPPFEQIKENIRRSLSMRVGEERLAKLKEQAKIEYPAGSAPPPPKAPSLPPGPNPASTKPAAAPTLAAPAPVTTTVPVVPTAPAATAPAAAPASAQPASPPVKKD